MSNIISHIHCNRLLRLVQYISRYLDIYTPLTLERKAGLSCPDVAQHSQSDRAPGGCWGNPDCRHASYMHQKQVDIALLLVCPVDICISRSVLRVITSFATVR